MTDPVVLGLDISTSCTGWTILAPDGTVAAMGHIDFKGCASFWQKVDHALEQLAVIAVGPSHCFIEESLQSFQPGMSSASTLLTLGKFNGLLSYAVRQTMKKDPFYISASQARKACGVKLTQKKKSPFNHGHKQQTFTAISGGLLKGREWPMKRTADPNLPLVENVVPWALDECDSFVIAYAGWLSLNTSRRAGEDHMACSRSPKRSGSSRASSEKATLPGT